MPLFKPNSTLYVIYSLPEFKTLFIDCEQNLTSHEEAFKYARKFILVDNYDIHAFPINGDGEIIETNLNPAWNDWKQLVAFYDSYLIYKYRTESFPIETYITLRLHS